MGQNENENRFPHLIGHGADDVTAELNSIDEAAQFIMAQGQRGDVRITYEDGRLFLDTYGYYLNRITDVQYRQELLEILTPMRRKAEVKTFGLLPPQPSKLFRLLTHEEIDVICANHVLWLRHAGGQQANFSYCMLKGADLVHRNLVNAVFVGARLSSCDLRECRIAFSKFSGAFIDGCNMDSIMADSANFTSAAMARTSMQHGFFTSTDFTDAQFRDCIIDGTRLQNCCFDGTEFGQTDTERAEITDPVYDHLKWSEDEQPVMT